MKKIFSTALLAASIFISGCGDSANQDNQDNQDKTTIETKFIENVAAVAASTDIDWESAPRFDNKIDLAAYLNECRKNLITSVPVVLTNGFLPDMQDLFNGVPVLSVHSTTYNKSDKLHYVDYELTNYPGERVAYAYLHGDTSFLNEEEMKLYNEAEHIIKGAKYNSSGNPLYEELAIHDAITRRSTYYTEEPQPEFARFKTATGALIDGKANCQGYADAFYMLGTMCGFNVDKILGIADGDSHVWNTINFGDGKTYFVDVTFDDPSFNSADTRDHNIYIYFNAPTDVVKATHSWYSEYAPMDLQDKPDRRYFYYTKEYEKSRGKHFGTHAESAEKALDIIAYHTVKQGWSLSYVAAPYDAKYSDPNVAVHYLTDKVLPSYNWSGKVWLNVVNCGDYMFFTAEVIAR